MLTILKVNLNFQHYRKCQMYRKIEGILPNTMSPLQRITLNILLASIISYILNLLNKN